MAVSNSTRADSPHHETINGLCRVIRFLSDHPELAPARAHVWLGDETGILSEHANTREDLTRFAIAADGAGWAVSESEMFGAKLEVDVCPGVSMSTSASLESMGAVPPPSYAPVLPKCPECRGKGRREPDDTGFSEACGTCDGRGYLLPEPPARVEDFTDGLSAGEGSW